MEIAIENTNSMASASRLLKMNYKTFKKYASEFGIFVPNQALKGVSKINDKDFEDIINNKRECRSTTLKNILLLKGIIKKECYNEDCNIKETWLGKEIKLELDHIDGNHSNNNLNNLRLLCPNCHSQTPTYKNRGRSSNKKYTDDELINAVKNSLNVHQVCKKLGITPKGGNFNSIRNQMKKLNLVFNNEFEKLEKIYYCNCDSGDKVKTQKTKCNKCKLNRVRKDNICKCGTHIHNNSKQCEICLHKNQRKVERPPYNILKQELNESNYSALGRKYGVSDNTIRKWLKMYEKYGENY